MKNYAKRQRESSEGSRVMNEFQGITLSDEKPRIITLCGSSRFCGEMAILAWEFEKGGVIALGLHLLPDTYCEHKGMTPDEDGRVHHIGEQEGVEDAMDALHFKKIEMADSIYVVNVNGYIGSSTAREIAYAEHIGKPISYLEPICVPNNDPDSIGLA